VNYHKTSDALQVLVLCEQKCLHSMSKAVHAKVLTLAVRKRCYDNSLHRFIVYLRYGPKYSIILHLL